MGFNGVRQAKGRVGAVKRLIETYGESEALKRELAHSLELEALAKLAAYDRAAAIRRGELAPEKPAEQLPLAPSAAA